MYGARRQWPAGTPRSRGRRVPDRRKPRATICRLEALVSTSNPARSAQPEVRRPTPQEAVAVLLEGHERFIEDRPLHLHQDAGRRAVVSTGQHPFALIL